MGVIIGIDPHKASHTAAAIDPVEAPLGQVRVRAAEDQLQRLLAWAQPWPKRTWAVEGAGGLGYLLAQQLVAAGERVVDVQPKLAPRVRLLANGSTNKNDPNDARSVAVAALRSPGVRVVVAEDHTAVMKLWAKRQRDLSAARTQVVCRLHAVVCDLVPGGVKGQIRAPGAARLLEDLEPVGAVAVAHHDLATQLLADLVRIDEQIRQVKDRLAVAVAASRTSLTKVFGVGPVVAATILGEVADAGRIPDRHHFAAYNGTAPIEVSSGPKVLHRLSRRGNRRINHAIHMAAVTQVAHRNSPGRGYYDRKLAEGKTGKEALRALKRRVSDAVYTQLLDDARHGVITGPGGQPGNVSDSSATGSHPERRLFGSATPGPTKTLRPPTTRRAKPATAAPAKKTRRAS